MANITEISAGIRMIDENPYGAPSAEPSKDSAQDFIKNPRQRFLLWLVGMLFTPIMIATDEMWRFMPAWSGWLGFVIPLATVTHAITSSHFSVAARVAMWIGSALLWWILTLMTSLGLA